MSRRTVRPATVVLLWALFTFGPILPVLLASAVAGANGCRLDESGSYPCVVAGVDVGGALSTMGVMGWLMLLTLPLGLVGGLVGAVGYGVRLALRRRSGTASPDPGRPPSSGTPPDRERVPPGDHDDGR